MASVLQTIRRVVASKLLVAAIVIVGTGTVGSYILATSHAQSPGSGTLKETAPRSLLRPYSLGIAPYQYIAYSGSLSQTQEATSIKQYFAAFMISSGSCTPAWGGSAAMGLTSQRSASIAADITKLRYEGGDVAVSFGGSNGTDLATSCLTTAALTAAYRDVINTYGLKRIDFDIEGQTLADTAGNARRAEAIASLQESNPDLRVWVTLPVRVKGLTDQGVAVVRQLRDSGVIVSGVNIMAMNYNIRSKAMGQQAIDSSRATFAQLHELFPGSPESDIWKALGITVMVGRNNTSTETFSLADAPKVRDFALQQGVGMLSMWSVSRDIACQDASTGGTSAEPSVSCSGVAQQHYQFLRALTIPARK